ncbi:MAG: peptidoglycan-binding protein [Aristaeellaceae bacterium]
MDFLKTLMLYMTLTFATSVQGAEPPTETPVPTASPTAVVELMPSGTVTAAVVTVVPTQTPSATPATVTPRPNPTITPNTGYRNLQLNSRGAQVKRLQARLIELGYLTGEADGAFGRQTYNAVLAFQRANGLVADGVAGDATQTILFESPDVIAKQPQATATPTLTFTPAPSVSPTPAGTLPQLDELPMAQTESPATAAPTAAPTAMPTAEPAPVGPVLMQDVSIVLNDSGDKLTCLRQEDGVTIRALPRVWQTAKGQLLLDMADLAASVEGWGFSLGSSGVYTFVAEGYTVTLTPDGEGFRCQADGVEVAMDPEDFLLSDDAALCSPALLEKALSAQTLWDSEEQTLMIRLLPRELVEATD